MLLLRRFGTCAPQPATDWTGDFALPDDVARFYREVGPAGVSVPSHGNDFWFPPLARLWELQAGYRWDGGTGEQLETWPRDWLVVGDQGGDPLVRDGATGALALRWHGAGSWDAGVAIPGALTDAVGAIALFGALVEDAGEDRFTEDFDLDPAWFAAAAKQLTERFGETGTALVEWLSA